MVQETECGNTDMPNSAKVMDSMQESAIIKKKLRKKRKKTKRKKNARSLLMMNLRDLCGTEGANGQLSRMIILILVPIITLVVIASIALQTTTEQNNEANELSSSIKYSIEIGKLVYSLQRERDMTALYLIDGSREILIYLHDLYEYTDDAIKQLSQWTPEISLERLRSKEDYIQYLQINRNDLSRSSNVYDEIRFYTDTIARFTDWVLTSVKSQRGYSIWRQIVAYHLLLVSREDVGVERALGGVFFAKGFFEESEHFQWYMSVLYVGINVLEKSIRYSPMIGELYNTSMAGERERVAHGTVDEMRQLIIAGFQRNHNESVRNVDSSLRRGIQWFDNVTIVMDAMYLMQTDFAVYMLELIDDKKSNNIDNSIIDIFLLIFVLLMSPIVLTFIYINVSSIKHFSFALLEHGGLIKQEQHRADKLLSMILPPLIIDLLKQNKTVNPEIYNDVTVFFSEVIGFNELSKLCSPIQTVNMLSNIYHAFDGRLAKYDVYKIETIGHAYMVASGVPRRNGSKHAAEICTMALDLVHTTKHIMIPNSNRSMAIKVGIHSGAVVAGIIGVKMPRYCLFGDTVNTASRMETSSTADHVHISKTTYEMLALVMDDYRVISRGCIDIKGKGEMETYWLLGKTGLLSGMSCFPNCSISASSLSASNCNSSLNTAVIEK